MAWPYSWDTWHHIKNGVVLHQEWPHKRQNQLDHYPFKLLKVHSKHQSSLLSISFVFPLEMRLWH